MDPEGVYAAAEQAAARRRHFPKIAGPLRVLMKSGEPMEVEVLRLSADGGTAIVRWDTGVEEVPTWSGVMAATELQEVRGIGVSGLA